MPVLPLELFSDFAAMNETAVRILVRVILWTYVFSFLRKHLAVDLPGHKVSVCLDSKETARPFPKLVITFNISSNMWKSNVLITSIYAISATISAFNSHMHIKEIMRKQCKSSLLYFPPYLLFIIIYLIYIIPFLLKIWVSISYHFPSAWKSSLSISYRAGLLVIFFVLTYLRMSLFRCHSWKLFLLVIEFWVNRWSQFFFQHLKILRRCPLDSIVSHQKLAITRFAALSFVVSFSPGNFQDLLF